MGLIIGIIKLLIRLLLYFTIFAVIIVLIPNLPPYTTFTAIKLAPTQPSVGPLAPNGALNNAEKLYKDKLLGPEAFQLYNGEVYTSLATGEIVKVSPGGHVSFVTKIGQPCIGIVQEHICGRPLGFQIDEKANILYVADAYLGIWKIDLKTDKKQLLVSPRVPINDRKPKLFNSLALAKNGDIYWTDSSSDFHLKDGVFSLLADPSGRLLYYNVGTNQSKVLLDGLWFPNDVIISPDHQFVLVTETSHHRIVKYYVEGPKKGISETFLDGLPGIPDNLRTLPDGSGVLLALYVAFDDDHPQVMKAMSETPLVRKFLARIQRLIEIPFEYLNNLYPHIILEEIIYFIGHFRSVSSLTPGMSGLVQVDWNGKVIASYFNTDGTLGHISDAIVYNGKLYTGSPHQQNFIGSVPAPPLLLNAFNVKVLPKDSKPLEKSTPIPTVQEKPIGDRKNIPKSVESASSKPVNEPVKTPKPATPTPEQKKPVVDAKPAIQTKAPSAASVKQSEQKTTPEVKLESTKQTKPSHQQPEHKHAAKSESKPTPKPEAKLTTKPEVKPISKPEAKPTPRSEVKLASQKETKPVAKPEVKSTPKSEEKPTSKPEANLTPKPEVKPTPKPEIKPTPKPETKPTPKPEVKPTPKQEVKPKSQAKSKSTPEVQTTPMPKSADIKHTTEKPIAAQKPSSQNMKSENPEKQTKQEIPIKEEISSDTAKPNKHTLKVIKKGGPAEIPNPNSV